MISLESRQASNAAMVHESMDVNVILVCHVMTSMDVTPVVL